MPLANEILSIRDGEITRRVSPGLFTPRTYRFTCDYPPSDNNLYATIERPGKCALRVSTSEAKKFKKQVAVLALAARVQPHSGDVVVLIDVYRPRKAGDCQNRGKALIDALKGIAFADDEQVAAVLIARHDDPANPRAEVEIRAI